MNKIKEIERIIEKRNNEKIEDYINGEVIGTLRKRNITEKETGRLYQKGETRRRKRVGMKL